MRVLVTGASGLVGTRLCRRAPAGVEVVGLVHTTAVAGVTDTVEADLRDGVATARAVATADPDLVVHTAYRKDRAGVVAATANLAEAVAERGCGLVLLSSDVVFAGDGRWCAEDAPPAPVSDYGRWKVTAEQTVRSLVPDAAVVRLSLVIATDAPADATTRAVLAAARDRDGGTAGWYDGETRMPSWADNVADGLWRIARLDSRSRGGDWHLTGPSPLTRRELADRIAALVGVDPAVNVTVPAPPASERPHDLRLSCTRARREIGWDPRPVG